MIYTYQLCKFVQNFVKNFEQENSSFQDLELSMNLCLVGSKYIKMHTFEQGKYPLISLRSPSLIKYKKK